MGGYEAAIGTATSIDTVRALGPAEAAQCGGQGQLTYQRRRYPRTSVKQAESAATTFVRPFLRCAKKVAYSW